MTTETTTPETTETEPLSWYAAVTGPGWLARWIVSLVVGGLIAAAVVWFDVAPGYHLATAAWAAVAALLCALFVIDWATSRLPDTLVKPAISMVGGFFLVDMVMAGITPGDFGRGVACAFAGYAAYFTLAMILGGGIGRGDMKLAALLGLTFGVEGWSEAITATIIGPGLVAIVPVLWMLARGKTQGSVPFGPFMAVAAITVMFAGPITAWV